ncbi:MAG: virulence factor [Anaerolineae bacterium]
MAKYQILYWRHIPLGVKAWDMDGVVRENLSPRFQEAVDQAAMRASGQTSGPAYTTMFKWSKEAERDGTAKEVVKAIVGEMEAKWPGEIPLEE